MGFWAVDPVWSPPQAPGASSSSSSTVEGQNSGTPFLLIIPEGARARVRTRTRVRVRARTDPGAFRND